MKNNEIQNLNLLGLKRNLNNLMQNDESKIDEGEKIKQNNPKKLTLKKPQFYESLSEANSGINLEEKNGAQITHINKTSEPLEKNICQRCNSGDNLLSFNSCKNIIDYLSKKKILISKNLFSNENIIFDTPKTICLNCLLMISKNKIELEKFIASNKSKNIEVNDNPFDNLFENSNLKMFNNIEPKNNKTKNQKGLNEKLGYIPGKSQAPDTNIPSSLNIAQNTNNNIFNNGNINLDYLNNLNYQFLPSINYNMPFNQNIANLNIPYNNDLNSLFTLNNLLKNPENKDNNNINNINNIIQNNQLPNPLLNYSDILQNSLLNKPVDLFTSNNTGLLNLCPFPVLNKSFSMEKKSENGNGLNTMKNSINTINDKEKVTKGENENSEQKINHENLTFIKNKDFDEIFQITYNLYHKLLDIKVSRDLNLDTKKLVDKYNQISLSNNLNFFNDLNNNINKNLDLNQLNNNNNFNNINFNSSNHNLNKDLYSNQNTVENHINLKNMNNNNYNNKSNKN